MMNRAAKAAIVNQFNVPESDVSVEFLATCPEELKYADVQEVQMYEFRATVKKDDIVETYDMCVSLTKRSEMPA